MEEREGRIGSGGVSEKKREIRIFCENGRRKARERMKRELSKKD